ncbi:sigma-54 factor interaction domain-containing protein, partial [Arhodomonas sp. KWT]|uniref:sigma-54 factor interaction domain-containing protein n=1 Tax=Arhodomonas sp. KWT TaxID=2679915 RepID=UPI0027397582
MLVEGETGTGKEYLAHRIHHQGPRAGGPLVVVNCAAIPDGLIESELFGYAPGAFTGARREGARGRVHEADGGTLFLDEIGEMPQALQTRLLRVLQEQRVVPVGGGHEESVDFALIAATNRDLAQCVAEGTFRADLYYRLNGLRVRLPPLRERA